MNCTSCGKALSGGAKFCGSCGTTVAGDAATAPRTLRLGVILVGVAVGFIVLLLVGIAVESSKIFDESPTSNCYKTRPIKCQGANLHGADLTNVNLYDANLHGADLTNANLKDAYLDSADLRDANLSNANLTNAVLFDANLKGNYGDGDNLTVANRERYYGRNSYHF